MAGMQVNDKLDVLGPLGRAFDMPSADEHSIMVAGGVGFPPLLFLAERMVEQKFDARSIEFFYGGQTSADILEQERLKRLGLNFIPVTEDGSLGQTGLVTEPVEEYIKKAGKEKTRIYSCGPEGMLKAVNELAIRLGVAGQVSLEAPMPCGVGICLGCVVPLIAGGHARVCREGPVFDIGEVIL
jgi:dihydroorotate dehydrogenase electron transfer subunit